MVKTEWVVKKEFRCACGETYVVKANTYNLLFQVEVAIAGASMMNHKVLYCPMNTIRIGDRT